MTEKIAAYSGQFTPSVNTGDFVTYRQQIGTILFGNTRKQLANVAGQINWIQNNAQVNAGDVICKIDETATPPET